MSFAFHTIVAWSHLDANGHMANTAYLDIAVDARFDFFTSHGFSPREFAKLNFGPVVRRDEVDYFRELRFQEPVTITMRLAGLSEDASRLRLAYEILRGDGQIAARVTSTGGWMDKLERKLIVPPPELAKILQGLQRSTDFATLESSLKP